MNLTILKVARYKQIMTIRAVTPKFKSKFGLKFNRGNKPTKKKFKIM